MGLPTNSNTMANRILIVDDEPDICEILRFNLEMDGYDVLTAEGADEAQRIVDGNTHGGTGLNTAYRENGLHTHGGSTAIGERPIDLILLDVMMTPKSGFEWARELKSNPRTAHIPIIFCTAKTMEEDLLQGFALGSDDYIRKPFRVSEVRARVKAVLRRASDTERHTSVPAATAGSEASRTSNLIRYEGIVMDLDRKECRVDGKEVVFTKLEFELLALLLSRPGHVFSREKILQTVWPSDAIVLDRTVDVNITRIRRKIGPYGEYLRTKFGYGYMFRL